MTWKIDIVFADHTSLDVTEQLLRFVSPNGTLDYSAGACPLQLPQRSEPVFFKVENRALKDWRPLRILYGVPFSLKLAGDADFAVCKTKIVYFFNCYVNTKYIFLFAAQMRDLLGTRLLQDTQSTLYIVSCGSDGDKAVLAAEIRRIFPESLDVRHEHSAQNAFEYPGIQKVWQLGQEDADAFVLYFHGRGLSRIKLGRFRRNRQSVELGLFDRVIREWRSNLLWLLCLSSSEKLGINCGGNGWLWFNFWWARASYLAGIEQPVVTERRHYYEDWLGRWVGKNKAAEYPNSLNQCLSVGYSEKLGKYNIGSDFHPLRGETHLGLRGGELRFYLFRLRSWLQRLVKK